MTHDERNITTRLCLVGLLFGCAINSVASDFKTAVESLVESSCMDCHDADTDTALNFDQLGFDLTDADAFKHWEKVFDRVEQGEMPPPKERRPDAALLANALAALRQNLRVADAERQKRVASRFADSLARNTSSRSATCLA